MLHQADEVWRRPRAPVPEAPSATLPSRFCCCSSAVQISRCSPRRRRRGRVDAAIVGDALRRRCACRARAHRRAALRRPRTARLDKSKRVTANKSRRGALLPSLRLLHNLFRAFVRLPALSRAYDARLSILAVAPPTTHSNSKSSRDAPSDPPALRRPSRHRRAAAICRHIDQSRAHRLLCAARSDLLQ